MMRDICLIPRPYFTGCEAIVSCMHCMQTCCIALPTLSLSLCLSLSLSRVRPRALSLRYSAHMVLRISYCMHYIDMISHISCLSHISCPHVPTLSTSLPS